MVKNKKKKTAKSTGLLSIGKYIQSQHLKNILNDSPDGLVIFDVNNTILEWNKGAAEIFGYERKEVIGRKFEFLIPSDIKKSDELSKMQQTVEETGYIKNHQTERIRKDGRRIIVEITRTPIKDRHGKTIAYTALVRDKSEYIEIQNRLRQTEKLSALGQLIAGFAHEIGTPLSVIVGNAELMSMELEPGNPHKEYLQKIITTAERVSILIKRMLHFSAPRLTPNEDTDINDILEDLYILLKRQLDKNNIKVQLSLHENMPPVKGDKIQLGEVFLNIIINAWHAISSNGIISIRTSMSKEGNKKFVNIRISDTGCGMSKEIQARIFEPFFTTKDPKKGTGLGLYVAHNIIEKHGGMIRLSSKPGKGTIFHVLLPSSDEQKDISSLG